MYKLIVSLRYLRKKKLNLFAIAGVAIGVMVLIVVLSVMTGFDEQLRARVRGTLSHLIVERWSRGQGMEAEFGDYDKVMAAIENTEHVEACAPHLDGLGLFKVGPGYKWGMYRGIDLGRECRATQFAEYWRTWRGAEALEECRSLFEKMPSADSETSSARAARARILECVKLMRRKDFDDLKRARQKLTVKWARGKEVDLEQAWHENAQAMPTWGEPAGEPKKKVSPVIPGRDLLVIGRDEDGKLVSLQRDAKGQKKLVMVTLVEDGAIPDHRLRRCRVVGQFKSGMYEYDQHNLYMPLADVQDHLRKRGKISSIAVRLDDYRNADIVRSTIMGLPTLAELNALNKLTRKYVARNAPGLRAAIAGALDQLRIYRGDWLAQGNPKVEQYSLRLRNIFFDVAFLMTAEAVTSPPENLTRLSALRRQIKARLERDPQDLPILAELEEMNELTREYVARSDDDALRGKMDVALGRLRRDLPKRDNIDDPRTRREIKQCCLRLRNTFFDLAYLMTAQAVTSPSRRLQRLMDLRQRIKDRLQLAPEPKYHYRVSTWEDRRRNILRAVEVERRVMAVILTLIMLVAGFLIFALLHTTVVEKTRDIGVLKAIGGTMGGIMTIFLLNGLLIGVIGSILGVIGGLLLCRYLNAIQEVIYWLTNWRVFPREVYAFDKIPVDEDPLVSIIIIASAAVLVSFLAAIHPARRAARLEAVEAIRYE